MKTSSIKHLFFTFLISGICFGGTTDECKVLADVVSLEELSIFDKGSVDVPDGVNPDNKPKYTYKILLTLDMVSVFLNDTPGSKCFEMRNTKQKVLLENQKTLKGIKPGDRLKLSRTRRVELFGPGKLARSEVWRVTQ